MGTGEWAARETICAQATPPGRGGIAVVRLSGPAAGTALVALSGGSLPPPRRATLTRLCDPADGTLLDHGLVLWFPGPKSFTGENVVELHLHGGTAVVAAVLDTLRRLPGLRLAGPGEFTRRAFEAGRLDLTEVEGLADLIAAETEAQRRQALRQAEGGLSALCEAWRARLVVLMAHLEATIDFADEDVPQAVDAAVFDEILDLSREVARYLDDGRRGERLRDGVSIAIVGPPNAGKSSLLNRLARRDVAIVAATAGTTRDVIEVYLDLGGLPARVADTAGLREVPDAVEAEGVRRARRTAAAADLRLLVMDACEPQTSQALMADGDTIVVWNKLDLVRSLPATVDGAAATCFLSVASGAGFEEFLCVLEGAVADRAGMAAVPVVTRARHREALEECTASLDRAARGSLPELVGEDLRLAARALAQLVGRVDVEELLDVVFRDFCIGK